MQSPFKKRNLPLCKNTWTFLTGSIFAYNNAGLTAIIQAHPYSLTLVLIMVTSAPMKQLPATKQDPPHYDPYGAGPYPPGKSTPSASNPRHDTFAYPDQFTLHVEG